MPRARPGSFSAIALSTAGSETIAISARRSAEAALSHPLQHTTSAFGTWLLVVSTRHDCSTAANTRRDTEHAITSHSTWHKELSKPLSSAQLPWSTLLQMKSLLIVPHYFHAEDVGDYGSTSAAQRSNRRVALERSLVAWRALFGPAKELDIGRKEFVVHEAKVDTFDIIILTYQEHHLLDQTLLSRVGAQRHNIHAETPRLLPFGAHVLIKRHVAEYDWFIYSEDDLLLHDPDLFRKQMLFRKRFGQQRLLQPNRFEVNAENVAVKTYVDGPLRPHVVQTLWSYVSDDTPTLLMQTELGDVGFERARNPHSGFFMLSQAQARHWVEQPHFLDLDCSFVSPLESAGSLSLMKTFGLYKATWPYKSYCEIEHQDRKFSCLTLPERSNDKSCLISSPIRAEE